MVRRLRWYTLVLSVLLSVAACVISRESGLANDDDNAPEQCFGDLDCVLAGPTCCDCPTYALPASTGWADGCANVDCPMVPPGEPPSTCAALIARCDFGVCTAACGPVACDMTCAQGFAPDAAGCLTCACNSMQLQPTCTLDDDCVEVPADCCGCERGGSNTAVPRALADEHLAGLNCPTDPSMGACPDVSTCDPLRVPRCRDQQCALIGPNDPGWPAVPPGACGRPDLPPCPAGEVCVLNHNMEAGPLGLGVCEAP